MFQIRDRTTYYNLVVPGVLHMADHKLKVATEWGAKNTKAKFRVQGRDLAMVAKDLSSREEWGDFKGSFTHKWKGDAHGNALSVIVSPTFTIKMPTWRGYRNQPQVCKDEWDRMWVALKKHEQEHQRIFESGITKLVHDLEALEAPTGTDVDNLAKEAKSTNQAKHDAFDKETDNGASRGVELNITQECRSKS